ncbi:glycosyltransferase [Alphaproteobacteria bacterium]|nr:glycosyltransferase [Alphaproteobacteria bacterium]
MKNRDEMKRKLRRVGRFVLDICLAAPGIPIVLVSAVIYVLLPIKFSIKPRLLWGAVPLKSITYTSHAMQKAGHDSQTVVIELYSIVSRNDFDHCLISRISSANPIGYMQNGLLAYWFFSKAIHRFDIFHYFFDGGVLQRTALNKYEFALLKLLGKKLVLMPYGSDSFVYDKIPNLNWRHALSLNYPDLGNRARSIEGQIQRGTKYADCIVGCLVHTINLPRVDVLPLVWYPVDVDKLLPSLPTTNGPIRIAHAPNHRGPKGTKYILAAVERLLNEGYDVEMILIEGKTNEQVLEAMRDADIFVDQLIFGYALAAIEGMALGKVVITGYSPDEPEYAPFRSFSYFDECPAVSANTGNIYDVLVHLIEKRQQWPQMGAASRKFAEKRHSYNSSASLFQTIYKKIWEGQEVDLMNLHTPVPGNKKNHYPTINCGDLL